MLDSDNPLCNIWWDLAGTIDLNQLLLLLQAACRQTMQHSFSRRQSVGFELHDTFVVPTLSTISEESTWGLDPLRSHEIVDERNPRTYYVQFE